MLASLALAALSCAKHARRNENGTAAGGDGTSDLTGRLHAFEEARRENADFSAVKSWNEVSGADPIRIAALPWPGRPTLTVGLLRSASSLVLMDDRQHEMDRIDAPRSPTGLATSGNEIYVCGELSAEIRRYRVVGGRFRAAGSLRTSPGHGLRDLAVGPEGLMYVVDEQRGKLITMRAAEPAWTAGTAVERREMSLKLAPIGVRRVGAHLIALDLLAHTLSVFSVDEQGWPSAESEARITHDGPIWSFVASDTSRGLLIAAGGVENHALDRSGGFFGFIDSFVFLYRVDGAGHVEQLAEQNVSELGVVTPKAMALQASAGRISLLVTGYGSDHAARITWNEALQSPPQIVTAAVPPGIAAIAEISASEFVFADPLLDAWGSIRTDRTQLGAQLVSVRDGAPRRSSASRVGEALFFTTLMSPNNSSDDAHSRFTCETCHFEGYVDGRTHFTGRSDVYATTKPLRGLVNNRPYFSRALDPDLATVSMNEFRVASAGSGASENFSANAADFPWISNLGIEANDADDAYLRRALVEFLSDFSHAPNPAAVGRGSFEEAERRGEAVFRDHCETCHEARYASDDPSSRVPFEKWEAAIFAENDALVWARASYEKTGVVPYVHEQGARVPSLRRLAKKRPYFTNGSAPDLANVLDRARFSGDSFTHSGGGPDSAALSPAEKNDLAAFLQLL